MRYAVTGATYLGDAAKEARELGVEHRSIRTALDAMLTAELERLE